ncbi:MAG: 3-oxoacyl-ACP reductase FabG [Niameybacter sp.]|uniref:elongation factor P 5-aminopentanone reductase n=1 Tax=Niameybacter sp. TaxID=2033640 RepID=UPI002FCB26D0
MSIQNTSRNDNNPVYPFNPALYNEDIVLVTGSSRGIGRAIATHFASCGAKVILNGAHNASALDETCKALQASGYTVTAFLGDISNYQVAQELYQHCYNQFGDYPSILINNAGISYVGLFTDTSPATWNKMMTTNLNSAYNCCHLATPHMIAKHKGCIINISSIWGNTGASCEVAYSTSKSALNGFTKALAKELGPSNIRINAIACGWIDTEMNAHFTEEDRNAFMDEVPLCRTGNVEEVAQTCLYLASSAASYMTGQILTLDGGLL